MTGSKSRMQGKVLLERSATPVYVGIDVCKARLDVYIHPTGQKLTVSNDRDGLKRLKRVLKTCKVALVIMEATGKLHRLAHRNLHAGGFAVAVVNPLRSRLFAEALGTLAKTDAVDARMLAILGESLKPTASEPQAEHLETLRELVGGRDAAVAAFRAAGFTCEIPQATMYLWLALPPDVPSGEFAERLLEDEGVVVMPGSGFGQGGEGFFRVSFVTSPERIAEAAQRAGRVLASLKSESASDLRAGVGVA